MIESIRRCRADRILPQALEEATAATVAPLWKDPWLDRLDPSKWFEMYVQSDTLNIYLEFQLKHIETTSTTTAEDLFPVTSRDQLVLVLLIYKPSINCGLPPAPIGVPPQEIPNGTALSVTWYPLNLLVNRDFDYSNDNVGIYIMIIIYIYIFILSCFIPESHFQTQLHVLHIDGQSRSYDTTLAGPPCISTASKCLLVNFPSWFLLKLHLNWINNG